MIRAECDTTQAPQAGIVMLKLVYDIGYTDYTVNLILTNCYSTNWRSVNWQGIISKQEYCKELGKCLSTDKCNLNQNLGSGFPDSCPEGFTKCSGNSGCWKIKCPDIRDDVCSRICVQARRCDDCSGQDCDDCDDNIECKSFCEEK